MAILINLKNYEFKPDSLNRTLVTLFFSIFQGSVGDANFEYIDVWSSPFTWGGGPLPEKGDFVVIPAGMTLLLDIDTPVLSFLLIQGI